MALKFKAANPDGRLKAEMKVLDDTLHKASVRHRVPDALPRMEGGNYGAPQNAFPARMTPSDSRDHRMELKAIAPEAVFGQKMMTPEDLDWIDSKRQALQLAEFDAWAERYFDMRDPAIVKLVEQIMPEYFQKRIDQIEEVADLQKRVALLRLRPAQNKEDLLLEYAINSGKIVLPKGPIYQWESWYTGDQYNKAYERGLFNPRRSVAAPAGFTDSDRFPGGTTGPLAAAQRSIFQGIAAARRGTSFNNNGTNVLDALGHALQGRMSEGVSRRLDLPVPGGLGAAR